VVMMFTITVIMTSYGLICVGCTGDWCTKCTRYIEDGSGWGAHLSRCTKCNSSQQQSGTVVTVRHIAPSSSLARKIYGLVKGSKLEFGFR